jgi:hypothetical protein
MNGRWRTQERCMKFIQIIAQNPDGKRPLNSTRYRSEDNIQIDLTNETCEYVNMQFPG